MLVVGCGLEVRWTLKGERTREGGRTRLDTAVGLGLLRMLAEVPQSLNKRILPCNEDIATGQTLW
jgi:hypothetical protein